MNGLSLMLKSDDFNDLPQETINIVNFWMNKLISTFESFGIQGQVANKVKN